MGYCIYPKKVAKKKERERKMASCWSLSNFFFQFHALVNLHFRRQIYPLLGKLVTVCSRMISNGPFLNNALWRHTTSTLALVISRVFSPVWRMDVLLTHKRVTRQEEMNYTKFKSRKLIKWWTWQISQENKSNLTVTRVLPVHEVIMYPRLNQP